MLVGDIYFPEKIFDQDFFFGLLAHEDEGDVGGPSQSDGANKDNVKDCRDQDYDWGLNPKPGNYGDNVGTDAE